jgi:hypothetical protein
MNGLEKGSFICQPQQRDSIVIGKFEGMLTEGTWLRLVIEDVVSRMHKLTFVDVQLR